MKPYEILELSQKSDIQTVERRFMHLCSILQNNENSMGNNLDKYNELAFELLLSYSVYIIQYFHQNKINLTVKHQGRIFLLNENKRSLNQIYKYLANAKN